MLKHGILMTPDLAEKAHRGDKTVTRRLMKPQPSPEFLARGVVAIVPQWPEQDGVRWFMADGLSELIKPRLRPGMIVAIKETHWRWGYKKIKGLSVKNVPVYAFVAVDSQPIVFELPTLLAKTKTHAGYHKISSLFLPFDYARTHVEILDVRPERLQDIDREDMKREGCTTEYTNYGACEEIPNSINRQFRELWDSINGGTYEWALNPWVWRYSFKRLEKP